MWKCKLLNKPFSPQLTSWSWCFTAATETLTKAGVIKGTSEELDLFIMRFMSACSNKVSKQQMASYHQRLREGWETQWLPRGGNGNEHRLERAFIIVPTYCAAYSPPPPAPPGSMQDQPEGILQRSIYPKRERSCPLAILPLKPPFLFPFYFLYLSGKTFHHQNPNQLSPHPGQWCYHQRHWIIPVSAALICPGPWTQTLQTRWSAADQTWVKTCWGFTVLYSV